MPPLPDQLLSHLSEHLAGQMGWHFPADRWRDLEAGIESAAREVGAASTLAYARNLLQDKLSGDQIEVLAGAFTIGETYFFRDPQSFDILATNLLPALISARRAGERRLRIWSAGCCTGEEPYSIAILLDRLLPNQDGWQITLLATDINVRFLQKAAQGMFGEWSFRGAPSWLKQRYFRRVDQRRYELLPRIRSRVTFRYLNLIEDTYPSLTNNTNAMDLILCRNVLMYFSPALIGQVVRNFHRSLVTDGWFSTSAVETSPQLSGYFDAAAFPGATFYRRSSDIARVPAPGTVDITTDAIVYASGDEPPGDEPPSDEPLVAPIDPPSLTLSPPQAAKEIAGMTASPLVQGQQGDAMGRKIIYADALRLFESGRYVEASEALLRHRADVESDVDSASLLARAYANLGDLSAALTWAERAIANDRTNALSHYLRAVILQEQNLLEEAASALQRTLYLQPEFVLAHFALGNLEQRRGRRTAAARHFNNALTLLRPLDDNDVLPHADGMVAGRLKELIRAIALAGAA